MRRVDPVWQFGALIGIAIVASALVIGVNSRESSEASTSTQKPVKTVPPADRRIAPLVGGVSLSSPEGAPLAAPVGWNGGSASIPTNTWWAPLSTGAGAAGLWPLPLAARVSPQGRTEISLPTRTDNSDGTFEGNFIPTMFALFDAPPVVVDAGAFHASWTYPSSTGQTTMTMVQGSPFVELAGKGTVELMIPGPRGLVNMRADGRAKDGLSAGIVFGTSTGDWVAAASKGTSLTVEGTKVVIQWPASGGRFVAGPVPRGAPQDYRTNAAALASSQLIDTTESLMVLPDGSVDQVLQHLRTGAPGKRVWTLAPHQAELTRSNPSKRRSLGSIDTVTGGRQVVLDSKLEIHYPAVPILWSTPKVDGAVLESSPLPPLDQVSRGSYFGGKAVAEASLNATLSTDPAQQLAYHQRALDLLRALASPAEPPFLRWEPTWGKAVIEPAEFGSLETFNDHQLQYGYWVAAASLEVERQPDIRSWVGEMVEVLIADYGGTGSPDTTSDRNGTWSPYDGQSWAAGVAQFGAGNNLESISESSFAWWAAARWFLSTGQPEQAKRFIALLTIESHVTGTQWLPDAAMREATQRPWSGVVWAGKVDNNTWFDPAPESALGIRLLPLGPMSFSRYHDAMSLAAAQRRWAWCDSNGGCTGRWANLLDSDAAVAGRSQLSGPDPEPSVSAAMSTWWRAVWTTTTPAYDLRCGDGVIARRQGSQVVLFVSNPRPTPLKITCVNESGIVMWTGTASPLENRVRKDIVLKRRS
jgi:Glycosyl hydrolase family 81 C-terminal domain